MSSKKRLLGFNCLEQYYKHDPKYIYLEANVTVEDVPYRPFTMSAFCAVAEPQNDSSDPMAVIRVSTKFVDLDSCIEYWRPAMESIVCLYWNFWSYISSEWQAAGLSMAGPYGAHT